MNFKVDSLKIDEEKAPLEQMVLLYIDFFNKTGSNHKVQEIEKIYYKRLCPTVIFFLYLVSHSFNPFQLACRMDQKTV